MVNTLPCSFQKDPLLFDIFKLGSTAFKAIVFLKIAVTKTMLSEEQMQLTMRFLEALRRTQDSWGNDKQLTKIVEKMEKGEELKREEFERVYSHLRTHSRYY